MSSDNKRPQPGQLVSTGISHSGGGNVNIGNASHTVNGRNIQYLSVTPVGGTICKLGYCCEPKGVGHKPNNLQADYPIFIYRGSNVTEVEVGKNFMYEIVAEDNDIKITRVDVPCVIKYTLDYLVR